MRMNRSIVGLVAAALGAVITVSHAEAAPVTWDLDNVAFADGGTATGSFVFDASTDTYTAWSITTTATTDAAADGGYPLNGATYTYNTVTGASSDYYLNPYGLDVRTANSADNLALNFASMLTGAGGTIALRSGSESENFGFESRSIASGSVSAVPLPAGLPMFGSALLALAGLGSVAARREAVVRG
jgi:hypothetical protein